MLYVYFSEDVDAARKKVQATVASMLAKHPDALYFRVTPDVVRDYNFEELTGSQGLFKSEYVVVLDGLLADKDTAELVLDNIERIAAAPHPFFLVGSKPTAPVRKKLEKHAAQVHEIEHKAEGTAAQTFNTFALTDALGERDSRKLWILFREAKHYDVSDEEIHGVLFWMLKSLVFASNTSTPGEAGMKPYPYNKAKKFVKNFQSAEVLSELMESFALLPQHARRRGTPLEIELERFILKFA